MTIQSAFAYDASTMAKDRAKIVKDQGVGGDLSHIAEGLRSLAVPIDTLHLDPSNVRKHDQRNIDAIAGSLARFGQRSPLIVQRQGMVVRAGNGRLMAAKSLGWKHMAALVVDEDSVEATAFAIADNRTAELAEWDDEGLAALLQSMDADVREVAGFNQTDLDELMNSLTPPEVVEDEAPEPLVDPITKPGDLWLLGEHRLLCGDSTKAEDVGRVMNGEKAALCFTSPPYGAGNVAKLRDHYVKGADKRESFYRTHEDSPESWAALMDGWWALARPICDALIVNVQMLADNKRDLMQWIADRKGELIDVVVWDKGGGAPQMQANVLTNVWEFVLMFGGNATRAVPFADFHGTLQNIIRIDPRGKNESADVHRAVMPVALPMWAMADLCKRAQSVYDPFLGSGTTLIAAEQLCRKCYGIEIDPAYCDAIVARWEKLTGKKATLDV